jgi:hypothetical protein
MNIAFSKHALRTLGGGVAGCVVLQIVQEPAGNFPPVFRGQLPQRLLNIQNTVHAISITEPPVFASRFWAVRQNGCGF